MHVRLPELSVWVETVGTQLFGPCFGFTGTSDDLLPKPMDKHDQLVRCALQRSTRMRSFMHTTFGLTRKSLSKFSGKPQASWVQTQRIPQKSHWESYRLASNGDDHVRTLCDKALPRSWSMTHRALRSNRSWSLIESASRTPLK